MATLCLSTSEKLRYRCRGRTSAEKKIQKRRSPEKGVHRILRTILQESLSGESDVQPTKMRTINHIPRAQRYWILSRLAGVARWLATNQSAIRLITWAYGHLHAPERIGTCVVANFVSGCVRGHRTSRRNLNCREKSRARLGRF